VPTSGRVVLVGHSKNRLPALLPWSYERSQGGLTASLGAPEGAKLTVVNEPESRGGPWFWRFAADGAERWPVHEGGEFLRLILEAVEI
jgi:hypothetical protein